MNIRRWISVLLIPAAFAACSENPTAPVDEHTGDEELTIKITVTPDHVHIWQTEATFTVRVTDHHGESVTDFDTLRLEPKPHESDTWRSIDLTRKGDAYVGTYVFSSSGEYDLRVAGMRPGGHGMEVLHEMDDHFHVARAHADAAGHRVEFETDPGHLHEGDRATLQFWVMEAETDAQGNRAPITGLTPEIHCDEGGAVDELHDAVEIEPGLYVAEHDFREAGPMHAGLHFAAPDGSEAEAAVEIRVAHGH